MQTSADVTPHTVDPRVFFLTGKQPDGSNDVLAGERPALLAAYRDLNRLRYDFPLVLIKGPTEGAPVRSLLSVIDDLLRRIAPPGMESEQLRKMILRIEREIRTLAAAGARGRLSELWDQVATSLEAVDGSFGKSARIARAALEIDGEVLDCRPGMAADLIAHLWSAVQASKARQFRAIASRLAIQLEDILRADYLRSAAGRNSEALKAAIGPVHQSLFDFTAMSKLLPKSSPSEALPKSRRRRIESALAALHGQRFFAPVAAQPQPGQAVEPYAFRFDNCADAIAAYRARLPELVALVKALAIAELESDGAYAEAKHEAIFASFDAGSLSSRDLALFPDYLVTLSADRSSLDNAALMAALSSEAPLKVVFGVEDLFEEAPAGNGHSPGLRGTQFASLITALGEVFVMQSSSSNLYQLRERIMRGLGFAGSALFSVFSGAVAQQRPLPLYLSAAAAMQSRAFPAFSYDPSAGSDLASRFSLENNPHQDADWTVQSFEYADADMQRINQPAAFTFVDFLVCDPRYQHHFAAAPHGLEAARMIPAAQWIARSATDSTDLVPYVLIADGDNVLSRAIVDNRAISAARRCLETWHRLQELGGVHNSHAARLLEREKQIWEQQKERESAIRPPTPEPPVATAAEAAVAERSPDEAYIETERCSTCNECILINDRMFAYNANKQAYIADLKAGTYAQLVEAAESCQLAIIHPGKPINSAEPGLDDLLKRAQPFR